MHVIASSLLGASLSCDMPFKKSKAKAAVRAPGDPHPPKPAPPPRTTHVPTKEVVDEYVKVVGVENVSGSPRSQGSGAGEVDGGVGGATLSRW